MIVCLRVDERLIHGQVAMTWTKELKLNGLVVASDEAASNEIQKMTLKMAVPEENLIKRSYADSRRTGSTERTDRALSGHIFPGNTGDGKENGICNIKGMLIKIG